ncbi:MAG: hypothetical protein H8E44_47595 [Planctomycetes bacterium]|nr:hypothetical protein [Planctomycetota bacterium]
MLRKILIGAGVLGVAVIGLFVVSSRSVWDFTGYFQATADQTVDNLTEQLPKEIRDRKMHNELKVARQELIDRQVALNLSRNQVEQLREDIASLETSVAGREQLLAQAYPILKRAIDREEDLVRFASTDFTLVDFQGEIDDLITQQDRETRQLEVKREGLARVETSLCEGEKALADMRQALEGVEQEVAMLKTRREQAEAESSTLDLISSVTATQHSTTASIGENVQRMKQEVETMEARNNARRDMTPAADAPEGRLPRAWNRLETLKSYHERSNGQEVEKSKPVAKDEAESKKRVAAKRNRVSKRAELDAAEVVITVRPEDKQPTETP